MSSPNDRHYTSNGEWVKPDSHNLGYYTVGITAHRASQLGTINSQSFNYNTGSTVGASDSVCSLNGGGSGGDVHGALGGVLRNERLFDGPNTIGTDPWNSDLFTVQANPSDYNALMTAAQYDALIGS